jgi:cytochrome b561
MSRYSRVAIVLHWTMAILIIGLFFVGLWMHEAIHVKETKAAAFSAYQWHKSFGLTVLVLTFLRLAWRFGHRPPPLPSGMKPWEAGVAKLTHWIFYALMLAVPLSGWAMVSASPFGLPTIVFGLFEWPHLPQFAEMANKDAAEEALKEAHELLAFAMMGLVILHIGAALKHHLIDRDDVLARMLPLLRRR